MQLLDPRTKKKESHSDPIPQQWKILLVAPRSSPETPNFISKIDKRGKHKWLNAFTPAMGIRFIAENFGGVEVLEYPTILEFEKALDDRVDVVGISFLTSQAEEAKRMSQIARAHGVKEVWGGGWGIDTPGVKAHFDRSFSGYGEQLLLPVIVDRLKGGGAKASYPDR